MQVPAEGMEVLERIREKKAALGKDLLILTHHYQRKEIVDLGDFRGDSFALAKKGAEDRDARYIVFCGVHFMAESAAVLCQPHQTVQIPNHEAGCWMAEMADASVVEEAWRELTAISGEGSVVPVVYMNTNAAIKAFCGKRGGVICTSSNCASAFRWAFDRGRKILFVPDQHLGRNTANQMGIAREETIVWNPGEPLGGNSEDSIRKARLILWSGYCLVHTRFTVEQMLEMRGRFPEAKIVVHPECPEEVVALADACGSTGFIVKYVKDAPPGATIAIGTEINLVHRLAIEYPEKKVLDLHRSLCPNMFKINPGNLLWTLENIGSVNVVTVPEHIKGDSRLALDRMLCLA